MRPDPAGYQGGGPWCRLVERRACHDQAGEACHDDDHSADPESDQPGGGDHERSGRSGCAEDRAPSSAHHRLRGFGL